MKRNLPNQNIFSAVAAVILLAGLTFAQTNTQKSKRNSPFAPNPKGRVEIAKAVRTDSQNDGDYQKITPGELPNDSGSVPNTENETVNKENSEENSIAVTTATPVSQASETSEAHLVKKNLETAKNIAINAAPTDIYKVGAEDVLYISLQNAPPKESTYFTVSQDGTIDYPLAGGAIPVAGLTTAEIEATLQEKIKLYENADVSVKIRENNSHRYTVSGLVEKVGIKSLQREAYPLLVVKTEAILNEKADRAIIKRKNSDTETIDLKDSKSDNVLIFSGDSVEFTASADSGNSKQYFYIGGEIVSAGQKDFLQGMTLTQAILASGGLKKTSIKRIIIRRKNEEGFLAPKIFDLNSIKNGTAIDPEIKAGDTIEIGN